MSFQARKSGLSLIEVIVVIALLGLAGGAVGSAVLRQQRFHRDATAMLDARQGVRDAMEVLATDIRGSWSADTIRLLADSALELFASVGVSVSCGSSSGNVLTLAAESADGNTLTSFLATPDTGDFALVFRNRGLGGTYWERHRIGAFAPRALRPGCLMEGAAPADAFVLTLAAVPEIPVQAGSPIRFVRRARYSLYRSSDGKWYLGYRRCNAVGAPSCGSIQPLSGPYRAYSPDPSRTGFLFEYFDARGERVAGSAEALSVTRVDITARAEELRAGSGAPATNLPVSATASIAIRNRGM